MTNKEKMQPNIEENVRTETIGNLQFLTDACIVMVLFL